MSKIELISLMSKICLQSLQTYTCTCTCTYICWHRNGYVMHQSCPSDLKFFSSSSDTYYAHDDIHAHTCDHLVDFLLASLHPSSISLWLLSFLVLSSVSWSLTIHNQSSTLLWGHSVIQRAHPQLSLGLAFDNVSFVSSSFYWKDTLFLVTRSSKIWCLLFARILVLVEIMTLGWSDWKDQWGTNKVSMAYRSSLLSSTDYSTAWSSNSGTTTAMYDTPPASSPARNCSQGEL